MTSHLAFSFPCSHYRHPKKFLQTRLPRRGRGLVVPALGVVKQNVKLADQPFQLGVASGDPSATAS